MTEVKPAITRLTLAPLLLLLGGCSLLPGKQERSDYQPVGVELSQATTLMYFL